MFEIILTIFVSTFKLKISSFQRLHNSACGEMNIGDSHLCCCSVTGLISQKIPNGDGDGIHISLFIIITLHTFE
jgi:hypothetical protein